MVMSKALASFFGPYELAAKQKRNTGIARKMLFRLDKTS